MVWAWDAVASLETHAVWENAHCLPWVRTCLFQSKYEASETLLTCHQVKGASAGGSNFHGNCHWKLGTRAESSIWKIKRQQCGNIMLQVYTLWIHCIPSQATRDTEPGYGLPTLQHIEPGAIWYCRAEGSNHHNPRGLVCFLGHRKWRIHFQQESINYINVTST